MENNGTLTLSVFQLNSYIKRIVDAEEFLIGINIVGEVSNFKISGGNAYFDLKESEAQVSCVIFNCMFEIKNGDKIILFGKLNYHVRLGKLSFIGSKVMKTGFGDLYQKFLLLKEKLEKEGLFDEKLKKPIPKFAKKIGVATSETGAVVHDIINVARRKNPFSEIVIFPVKVQGEGSSESVIKALDYFETSDVECVILARGGGSFEDLSSFNDEKLARKIFSCQKPIISSVGHETDFTLADFVADIRASTPSVGAQFAFFDYFEQNENIVNFAENTIENFNEFLNEAKDKINDFSNLASDSLKTLIDKQKNNIQTILLNLYHAIDKKLDDSKSQVAVLMSAFEKQNPISILKKGFSVSKKSGVNITSINQVKENDTIETIVADGTILSTIKEIRKDGMKK